MLWHNGKNTKGKKLFYQRIEIVNKKILLITFTINEKVYHAEIINNKINKFYNLNT